MLSTTLLALAGAPSPEVREKLGEQEIFGVGTSHAQLEPVEVPSLGDQGNVLILDKGCGSAGACREAGEPHRVVVPWGRWVVGGGQRARRAPLPHGKRARFNWAGGRSAGPAAGRRTQALLSPLSLPAPAGAGRARSGAATESRARHRGKQPNPPRLLGLSQALAAREEVSRWPARLPG